MKAINCYLPMEHRIITGLGTVPVHAVRVMATGGQILQANRLYLANERRDGIFKLDERTYCIIEDQTSSFWEVTPVINDNEEGSRE